MLMAIQPNLIERTVFEAVRADAMLRAHYERQFAACHEQRDPARRDQAFNELHERWFNELGLRRLILSLVDECAAFRDKVARLMVTQAHQPRAQTAELFGRPGSHTVVIAVAASTLLDRSAFEYWARHEFLHIDDMLDPAFGHHIADRPCGVTAAARNLSQDRYAVLWAISVDARLEQRGHAPPDIRQTRRDEFLRAFSLQDSRTIQETFDNLWQSWMTTRPSHHTLLDWAEHGPPRFGMTSTEAIASPAPMPGASCALCGFPTFSWAGREELHQTLQAAIVADFPHWNPAHPICSRCLEIYQSRCGSNRIHA